MVPPAPTQGMLLMFGRAGYFALHDTSVGLKPGYPEVQMRSRNRSGYHRLASMQAGCAGDESCSVRRRSPVRPGTRRYPRARVFPTHRPIRITVNPGFGLVIHPLTSCPYRVYEKGRVSSANLLYNRTRKPARRCSATACSRRSWKVRPWIPGYLSPATGLAQMPVSLKRSSQNIGAADQ